MKNNPFAVGATGFAAQHLPPGEQTETVLRIIRLGVKFDHRMGKQPGYLHRYITNLVGQIPKPTFSKLLTALELEAINRDQGEKSPVERVSRSFEFVRFHDPRHGEKEITFGTLRDYLTAAKKENSGLPINAEIDLPQCDHAVQLPGKIKEKNYE